MLMLCVGLFDKQDLMNGEKYNLNDFSLHLISLFHCKPILFVAYLKMKITKATIKNLISVLRKEPIRKILSFSLPMNARWYCYG